MLTAIILIALFVVCVRITKRDVQTRLIADADLFMLVAVRLVLLICAHLACYVPNSVLVYLGFSLLTGWTIDALIQSALFGCIVVITISLLSFVVSNITGQEALGLGDKRLYFVASLFLQPIAIAYMVFGSALIGCAMALWYRLVRHSNTFPFGPAIVWSFFICFIAQLFCVL